jgi:hypothetical protein
MNWLWHRRRKLPMPSHWNPNDPMILLLDGIESGWRSEAKEPGSTLLRACGTETEAPAAPKVIEASPMKRSPTEAPKRNMPLNRLAQFIYALGLSCLVSACSATSKRPMPETTTPDIALAVRTGVTDCEWKAANQFDDNR